MLNLKLEYLKPEYFCQWIFRLFLLCQTSEGASSNELYG